MWNEFWEEKIRIYVELQEFQSPLDKERWVIPEIQVHNLIKIELLVFCDWLNQPMPQQLNHNVMSILILIVWRQNLYEG